MSALSRLTPPSGLPVRLSAVLMLFGSGINGPEVLLIQRAPDMRSHAGQPAFPGGSLDESDDGPVAAALREAWEEVGVDPDGVEVLLTLPELWVPPSGFAVTPVLAFWAQPCPVRVVDAAEVARVEVVAVSDLCDPRNRVMVRHPAGFVGPGFAVAGMLVWGFTAGLLDRVLELAGWSRPWDTTREVVLELG